MKSFRNIIKFKLICFLISIASFSIYSAGAQAQILRDFFQSTNQASSTLAITKSKAHEKNVQRVKVRSTNQLGQEFYLNFSFGRFVAIREANKSTTLSLKGVNNSGTQTISGTVKSLRDYKRDKLGTNVNRKLGKHRDKAKGLFIISQTTGLGSTVGYSAYILLGDGREFTVNNNVLTELDQEKTPGCDEAKIPGVTYVQNEVHEHVQASAISNKLDSDISASALAVGGKETVRVLVYYSPEARSAIGGDNAIIARANDMVTYANTAYANSNITSFGVELAGVLPLPGNENKTDFADNLYKITYSDGVWDSIQQDRITYNADLVSLLVENYQYCGIAWLMPSLSTNSKGYGFSVINWTCVSSFAHELGHNMGATHDMSNAGGGGLFSDSYGWRFYGNSGTQFRTVMAYAPGSRIPYFSNPDVYYDGTATGSRNAANNAATLSQTGPVVAHYLDSGSGGGAVATATPNPTSTPAGTPTFTPTRTITPTASATRTPGQYVVSGTVTDSNNRNMAGVRVNLSINNQEYTQFSDAAGYFRFPAVLGDKLYTLSAIYSGYSFQSQSGYLQDSVSHTLIGAQAQYALSGLVVDQDKQPISGVSVNGGVLGLTTSDAQGRFSFQIGRGISYSLSASLSGYQFKEPTLGGTVWGNQERVFVGFRD